MTYLFNLYFIFDLRILHTRIYGIIYHYMYYSPNVWLNSKWVQNRNKIYVKG